MGLSSGFTETMMNERMGQYLITLQVHVCERVLCRVQQDL